MSHSSTAQPVLFCCLKHAYTELRSRWRRLKSATGGGKSEHRVWRSGRLFARIRTEKDGNRKRKRDTAHDAVGSSPTGGAN